MEKKRIRLEVYRPKRKLEVGKETFPLFVRLGNFFMIAGGFISLGISSIVMGIKSFFHVKKRMENVNILNKNKRYVEVIVKKRQDGK